MKIGLPDEAIAAMYLIRTHYVVRVLEFYPETQTVDVMQETFDFTNTPLGQITVKNEFGQEVVVGLLEPAVLYGVPVKQLRWGQFSIQACPKKGDTGYIEVFTNDITSWKHEGGIAIPWSDRRFLKESCVFVPFVANETNATPDYVSDENTLVIKSTNASIVITDDGTDSNVAITSKTVNVTAENGVSITGDVSVTGQVTATKKIHSDEDVTASSTNVSLKDHKHGFTYSAGPTAGATGTTDTPS